MYLACLFMFVKLCLKMKNLAQNILPCIRKSRGGAVVARWAHNPEVVGSNPAPATKIKSLSRLRLRPFCFLLVLKECFAGRMADTAGCVPTGCGFACRSSFHFPCVAGGHSRLCPYRLIVSRGVSRSTFLVSRFTFHVPRAAGAT